MARVLLADNDAIVRETLRTILSGEANIEIVGEASNGEEAVDLAVGLAADVVLMDVQMPVLDGVEATRRLRQLRPACSVIILTAFDYDTYVFEGLDAGARSYLLKDATTQELVASIQTALRYGTYIHPTIQQKVVAKAIEHPSVTNADAAAQMQSLTGRERDIVRLLANGATNKEIAAHLMIAEGTVKNNVTNILEKLGARDRTQAALKAKELHLL
jgi:DNA-binding NarL/FixJ family response regulator